MAAILTSSTRIFNAQQIQNAFSGLTSDKMYLFIGKPTIWTDDSIPDTPVDSYSSDISVRRDLLAMKRITSTDVSLGVLRRDWVAGTYYDIYRTDYGTAGVYGVNPVDGSSTTPASYLDANYYVVTDEYNVYMCLWNSGNTPSLVKPTGTSTSRFTTADGYIWQYMYSISPADVLKFVSTNFIPVKQLVDNPGAESPYYTQWEVQQSAIPGEIIRFMVLNGGSGYPVSSSLPMTIVGDGSGCVATANTNGSGNIVSVTVTNPGSGYSWASVSVPTGTGSSILPMVSPRGGYGSDSVTQLGGHFTLISSSIAFDETDFPQANEYRRIGIIKSPLIYGTSTVASAPTLNAANILVFNSGLSGNFLLDEEITGTVSGAKGTVVTYDSATLSLKYIQVGSQTKSFINGESVVGGSSGAIGIVSTITLPDVDSNSGDLIYLEHRRPVTRQVDQTETIKITIES